MCKFDRRQNKKRLPECVPKTLTLYITPELLHWELLVEFGSVFEEEEEKMLMKYQLIYLCFSFVSLI
jgi:hypothetical protein